MQPTLTNVSTDHEMSSDLFVTVNINCIRAKTKMFRVNEFKEDHNLPDIHSLVSKHNSAFPVLRQSKIV